MISLHRRAFYIKHDKSKDLNKKLNFFKSISGRVRFSLKDTLTSLSVTKHDVIHWYFFCFVYINYIIHCKIKRDSRQVPKIEGYPGIKQILRK